MGRRGPQPKPLEQREREGTLRPSRHGAPVVVGKRVQRLAAPRGFTAAQKRLWRELVEPLASAELLQDIDRPALECMVLAMWRVRESAATIEREGAVCFGSNGGAYQHPAVGMLNVAMREYRGWCARFGLTPSDRVALGTAKIHKRTLDIDVAERVGESPRVARMRDSAGA